MQEGSVPIMAPEARNSQCEGPDVERWVGSVQQEPSAQGQSERRQGQGGTGPEGHLETEVLTSVLEAHFSCHTEQ